MKVDQFVKNTVEDICKGLNESRTNNKQISNCQAVVEFSIIYDKEFKVINPNGINVTSIKLNVNMDFPKSSQQSL